MCRFFGDLQIARNDEETASHGAVLCRAGGASVFAAVCHDKKARRSLLSSYERSSLQKQLSIFVLPTKSLEMIPKRASERAN